MSKPDCWYCGLLPTCPLNGRPVEELQIGLVKTYECGELVKLYLKFVEIGKFIKEEKEQKNGN